MFVYHLCAAHVMCGESVGILHRAAWVRLGHVAPLNLLKGVYHGQWNTI